LHIAAAAETTESHYTRTKVSPMNLLQGLRNSIPGMYGWI